MHDKTGRPEPILTEQIIAVVSGIATQDESNTADATALNDAALRMRIALPLPPDAEIVEAVAWENEG